MKPSISIAAAMLALGLSGVMSMTFAIENMTCALCPITVRTAMEQVEGVRSVQIDFDAKTATVVFDPSITTAGAIAAASTDIGYPAKPRASQAPPSRPGAL